MTRIERVVAAVTAGAPVGRVDATATLRAVRRFARASLVGFASLLVTAAAVRAQCPDPPGDAFAFLAIDPPQGRCPVTPVVRWTDPRVPFECGFLADPAHTVDCGEAAAGCVAACGEAAGTWNAGLAGRFGFVPADAATPVAFCDPNDGRTSVGGSDSFCDGTVFPSNVIAVTLRFTASDGSQIDADVTVNQRFRFSHKALVSTLSHEFGHVLGLDHPNECGRNANVLMRSASLFQSTSPCFVGAPVLDDVTGARMIYPQTGPTPLPLCGDADTSGVVIDADAVQALRAAAELPNDCMLGNCDVDGSGVVTLVDGVKILRKAQGLPLGGSCGR